MEIGELFAEKASLLDTIDRRRITGDRGSPRGSSLVRVMSLLGQIQKGRATGQSALPSRTDVAGRACQVGKVPSTEVSARRPCIGTLPLHRASTPNASTVGVHLMSFSGTDTRRVGFP